MNAITPAALTLVKDTCFSSKTSISGVSERSGDRLAHFKNATHPSKEGCSYYGLGFSVSIFLCNCTEHVNKAKSAAWLILFCAARLWWKSLLALKSLFILMQFIISSMSDNLPGQYWTQPTSQNMPMGICVGQNIIYMTLVCGVKARWRGLHLTVVNPLFCRTSILVDLWDCPRLLCVFIL